MLNGLHSTQELRVKRVWDTQIGGITPYKGSPMVSEDPPQAAHPGALQVALSELHFTQKQGGGG